MRKNRDNVTREVRKMNTKDLMVDGLYQRDVDMKRIARMAKDYDPCLVNLIKVSFRDGKYWIFDGRHTSVLEKTVRGNGGDVSVACLVYNGLTRLDEMELFVEQNGKDARPVNSNAKLRAMYNFGDVDVCGMVGAAQTAGVTVDFTRGDGKNKCVAPNTLLKCYMAMPREQFVSMLDVLTKPWQGMSDSFCREMLIGMAKFYGTYYGRFDPKSLVKSLSRVLPIQIVREGKSMVTSDNLATAYARTILRVYNNNRTTHRLADEL